MTKGNSGCFTSKTASVAVNKRWSEEGVGIDVQPNDIEAPAPKKQAVAKPPELRPRSGTTPVYTEPKNGTLPFSQMAGHGDPTEWLRKQVGRVLRLVAEIGKGAALKTQELLSAVFRNPEIVQPLREAGHATEKHRGVDAHPR